MPNARTATTATLRSRMGGICQARVISQADNPAASRVPIIEHPDVRRMLLFQASTVQAMRAMLTSRGNDAGDAALIHFGRVIREQIRASDTAARIGGEEFAIWLPRAPLDLGMRIAERIRIKLGTTPWDWNGRHWPLSASFGVAACPETNRSIENLPAQADAALYVAKNSGRNRVEGAGRGGA